MSELDKKSLTERDICTKFITPALMADGKWDQHQIREEFSFTKGRVIVRGRVSSARRRRSSGRSPDAPRIFSGHFNLKHAPRPRGTNYPGLDAQPRWGRLHKDEF
jgi:hypothetical protein